MALTWQERSYLVRSKLDACLAELPGPASTRVVAERLARVTELDPRDVGRVLVKIAKAGHTHADSRPDRNAFGRDITRWTWNPRAVRAAAPPEPKPRNYVAHLMRPDHTGALWCGQDGYESLICVTDPAKAECILCLRVAAKSAITPTGLEDVL